VVLALFKAFLFRLTQQSDLCLCSAVAIRDHPDLRELLGFFVNLLPIRTKLSSEMEFEQLIDQVTESSYRALEHQSYPFDLLVREIGRAGHGDTRPFLDVVYVFQNTSTLYAPLASQKRSLEDLPEPLELAFEFAKFDLCLMAENRDDAGIRLSLEFDTQLFKSESIEQYLRAIGSFADQITAHSIA
jgi:non-ribosomal peptide synthetase component F